MNQAASNDWVIVDSFVDVIHADIVRGRLEAEGIPAILGNRNLVSVDWFYAQATGGVQVLVPSEHVDEARKIIAEIDAGKFSGISAAFAQGDRCKNCGTTLVRKTPASWMLAFFSVHLLALPLPFRKHVFYCPNCKA